MTVTNITKEQYYQLLGLKTLATMYESKLKDLNLAVLEITEETQADGNKTEWSDGWAGELIYTERSVDEILEIQKIVVEDDSLDKVKIKVGRGDRDQTLWVYTK